MDLMQIDIKQKLRQWGRTALSKIGIDYPSVCIGFSPANNNRYHIPINITYRELEAIDTAIHSLIGVNYRWYEMIIAQYALNVPAKARNSYFELSNAGFFNELNRAEAFVLGIYCKEMKFETVKKGKAYYFRLDVKGGMN